MGRKLRNNLLKAGFITSTFLFGSVLTGVVIAKQNRTAISNELSQPTFKIENKTTERRFDTKYKNLKALIEDGKQLVRDIEAEGAVLLENNDVKPGKKALPLKENAKVSLFGLASVKPSVGGRGSSHTRNPQPAVDLKQGLESAGLKVNEVLYNSYKTQLTGDFVAALRENLPLSAVMDKDGVKASVTEYSDAAIFIINRTSGEGTDLLYGPKDGKFQDELALNANEKDILAGLTKLKQEGTVKEVIVLLNTTNQIQQKEFEPYDIDATIWMGHVGITGLDSIGKILAGSINPSGHLPDTFWYNHQDNPVMKNQGVHTYTNRASFPELPEVFSNDKFARYLTYQEGVYVGYRYTETRYSDVVMGRANAGEFDYDKIVSTPFGHGESYTTFTYSDYSATHDAATNKYDVSLKVTNTGPKAGKDAVQVYLQKPYTQYDIDNKIEKPSVELVGFEKTNLIEPGQSEVVHVSVDGADFKTYDANNAKTYIVEAGDYLLTAATDAHAAANNFLAKAGKNTSNSPAMTANGDESLVSKFTLEEDKETYSTSAATGKKITNLFDEYDINKLSIKGDNEIDYLSRNNWTKELKSGLKLNQQMVNRLMAQVNSDDIQSDEGKYPTYGADNGLQLIQLLKDEQGNLLDYDDPKWDLLLDELTWEETVKLVSNGLRCTEQSVLLGKPKTKDHNGPTGVTESYNRGQGIATEVNDPDGYKAPCYYPSIPVIAATFNKEIGTRFGDILGEDCLWAGYNGLYGIGLNTHRSPYAGRHFEYYSEDPYLAGTMAAHEAKELQAHGVNAYIKHFALNDQETQRTGINIWSNEQALREISLRPFEKAVVEGNASCAMASFTRIGLDLVPGSKALLTDYLRGELGMKGFVVTDMYNIGYKPEQMPRFLLAGCDLPDGEVPHESFDKYKEGYSKVAWAMRESAKRTLYATLHSNAMNGFDENTKVFAVVPPWEKAANGGLAAVTVLFAGMLATTITFVALDLSKKKKESK